MLNSFDLTVVPPACYTKGIVKLMSMNPFGVTMKRNEMRRNKTNEIKKKNRNGMENNEIKRKKTKQNQQKTQKKRYVNI